jgi:hypothetical protein
MNTKELIPLIGQMLSLGLKVAYIIEQSKEIDGEDKASIRLAITTARDKVSRWDDKNSEEITGNVVD